jgi:hypothetical protein
MNLCITLADVPGAEPVAGNLVSLHRWLTVDPHLFAAVRLIHRPGQTHSRSGAYEVIAPLAELGAPGLLALPLAIALWLQEQGSDLDVGYRCADGTEMVVKLSSSRNPEQELRRVIEAATAPTGASQTDVTSSDVTAADVTAADVTSADVTAADVGAFVPAARERGGRVGQARAGWPG